MCIFNDDVSFCRTFPYEDVKIIAPEYFAGLKYTEILNEMIMWTPEFRENLQTDSISEPHDAVCYIIGGSQIVPHPVSYPSIEMEYAPEDTCKISK